jgi:hypothetical protein
MKKPFKLSAISFKPKRKQDAAQVGDLPTRILIGTSLGTKEDAESLARSQIVRYFDTPDRSWLFVQEEADVGFHYEIHEGGEGHPLLPALLSAERNTDTGVILKPAAQHAIEVFTRRNGTLHSLVLPEEQSRDAAMDPRLHFSRRRMRPYSTTGSEWIKVGLSALSMGVLMISVAGVIHKSFSLVMDGYYEVAETLPTVRLLELSGKSKTPGDMLPAIDTLPVRQWQNLLQQPLQPGESVSQLSYNGGKWEIKLQKPVQDPESAKTTLSVEPVMNAAEAAAESAAVATDVAPPAAVRVGKILNDARASEGQHEMSHLRGTTK